VDSIPAIRAKRHKRTLRPSPLSRPRRRRWRGRRCQRKRRRPLNKLEERRSAPFITALHHGPLPHLRRLLVEIFGDLPQPRLRLLEGKFISSFSSPSPLLVRNLGDVATWEFLVSCSRSGLLDLEVVHRRGPVSPAAPLQTGAALHLYLAI
jgi:hypothetical protein